MLHLVLDITIIFHQRSFLQYIFIIIRNFIIFNLLQWSPVGSAELSGDLSLRIAVREKIQYTKSGNFCYTTNINCVIPITQIMSLGYVYLNSRSAINSKLQYNNYTLK